MTNNSNLACILNGKGEEDRFKIGFPYIEGTQQSGYVFSFGRYRGNDFRNVVLENPCYVLWCCDNIPWFSLSDNTKENLKGYIEFYNNYKTEFYEQINYRRKCWGNLEENKKEKSVIIDKNRNILINSPFKFTEERDEYWITISSDMIYDLITKSVSEGYLDYKIRGELVKLKYKKDTFRR